MADNGNGNGGPRIQWTLVVQVVAWVVGLMLAYNAMNARVSVVEYQVNTLHDDIQMIKSDQRNQTDKLNDVQSDVKQLLRRSK